MSERGGGSGVVARAARNLYVFHRNYLKSMRTGESTRDGLRTVPAWDGGVDRNGRRHRPVWPKLAAALVARGAELVSFVEAQFGTAAAIPEPNMLLGDAAFDRAFEYARSAPREAAERRRSQEAAMLAAVPREMRLYGRGVEDAARAVLRDPGVEVTPLFRHCFAAAAGATDMLPESREAALAELCIGFHAYSNGWRGFIPAGLFGEAVDILAALCGEGGEL